MKPTTLVTLAVISFSPSLALPSAGNLSPGGHADHHRGGDHLEHANLATRAPHMEIVGQKEVAAGPQQISFRLMLGGKELRARDLALNHEKKLHVILYDPSLTQFFHVHPKESNGIWETEVIPLSVNGNDRVWADGKTTSGSTSFTVSESIQVTGGKPAAGKPESLPVVTERTVGETKVSLTGTNALTAGHEFMPLLELSRIDGSEPRLRPYLGAVAHLVVVPLSGDELIHVHPMQTDTPSKLMIHTTFPKPGDYRVWVQFDDGGELKAAALSVNVKAL